MPGLFFFAELRASSFGIGVDRKYTVKWLFIKKKPLCIALKESTCIPRLL